MAERSLQSIGTIVRLQIQRSSLKVGESTRRVYDPSFLLPLRTILIDERGVSGRNENSDFLFDVHHRDHPNSKNTDGLNSISFLFTAHYEAMWRTYGSHLTNGIAGENILVQSNAIIGADELLEGVVIVTRDGRHVVLHDVIVAEPCIEFTRWVLGRSDSFGPDPEVTKTLSELRAGMRGFYASYTGNPVTIAVGDSVYIPVNAGDTSRSS